MKDLTTIAFDADDTLWHNESFFRLTEERFAELLQDDMPADTLAETLMETERKNLRFYGYGIKGFTLSMIETAIEVTHGQVSGKVISAILSAGREMLNHPVDILPEVTETLTALAPHYRLIVITKGDLFDQERKVAESGLADYFNAIEIVSEKSRETYLDLFKKHGTGAEQGMMVGNSLKSDVIPALQAGAWGVHIPYEITWGLERADKPTGFDRFRQFGSLAEVRTLLLS